MLLGWRIQFNGSFCGRRLFVHLFSGIGQWIVSASRGFAGGDA